MPSAVDLAVLEEVDEVHEKLVADGALEATGVPVVIGTRP